MIPILLSALLITSSCAQPRAELAEALPTGSPTALPTVTPSSQRSEAPRSQSPSASVEVATPAPSIDPSPALPALPAGALTTNKAKANVGKVRVVCGEVASAVYAKSASGSPTFLNLDRTSGRFTIVIWKEYRSLFEGAPEAVFAGEWICIQGKITTFREVPQITSLGGDIAVPSRFMPLTGAAARCLAAGANMSIECTVIVDIQRWENQLLLDALDAQEDAQPDVDFWPDDYVPELP